MIYETREKIRYFTMVILIGVLITIFSVLIPDKGLGENPSYEIDYVKNEVNKEIINYFEKENVTFESESCKSRIVSRYNIISPYRCEIDYANYEDVIISFYIAANEDRINFLKTVNDSRESLKEYFVDVEIDDYKENNYKHLKNVAEYRIRFYKNDIRELQKIADKKWDDGREERLENDLKEAINKIDLLTKEVEKLKK